MRHQYQKCFQTQPAKTFTIDIKPVYELNQATIRIFNNRSQLIDEAQWQGEPIIFNTVKYTTGIYYFQVSGNNMILDSGKFNIQK